MTPGDTSAAGETEGALSATHVVADGALEQAAGLAASLEVAEAAAVCAGFDMWRNHRVPRLGVGAIKVTDGPVGARGHGEIGTGTPALVLPCPTAMAATWDRGLVAEAGRALAAEARDRGASVLLAPTVNLHRTPLAGRNFECFSEDPLLTAVLATAYIGGVQSGGVAACVKHFVANDQEHERHSISAEVSETVLRQLYLLPFEWAVRVAGVWMVMSAYNGLGGTYCSENPWLLTDVLRDEWGFDGAVVSDWLGTHSTVDAALAGLDWEMPGPPRFYGPALAAAVETGEVPADRVRAMAANVWGVAARTADPAVGIADPTPGDPPRTPAERSVARAESRRLARELAAASVVLLANRAPGGVDAGAPVLPLDPGPASIAVIGPSADVARPQGGGSAQLNPLHTVTALAGLRHRFGEAAIAHEPALPPAGLTPLLDGGLLEPLAPDAPGVAAASTGPHDRFFVAAEYFDDSSYTGDPVAVAAMRGATAMLWAGTTPPGVGETWGTRWRGTVVVPEDLAPGVALRVGLCSIGPARLVVDGEVVCDLWDERDSGGSFWGFGSTEVTADLPVVAGQRIEVVVEWTNEGSPLVGAARAGAVLVPAADGIERAAALAASSEVAVVVVGLDASTESEGEDRTTLALPDGQDELVAAVAAANPATVVVVNAGAPVLMPWRNDVAAVVQWWYPGMEGGHALADVLSGDVNPSGRLPTTFPDALGDSPAHHAGDPAQYPGKDGVVHYDEGQLIGYRWFDARGIDPQWCFGHGLSYTTFTWSTPRLVAGAALGSGLRLAAGPRPATEPPGVVAATVEVDVTNTGTRDGHEVVQVYVDAPVAPDAPEGVDRPPRALAGFARVWVPAGATVTSTVDLDTRAFSTWDPAGDLGEGGWVVPAGTRTIVVGASSRDRRGAVDLVVHPPA